MKGVFVLLDSKKCMEIYEYCQHQYMKLEKKDKCYSPKHDRIVLAQAAKQFRMSEETVEKVYDLAAHVKQKENAKLKPLKISFNI